MLDSKSFDDHYVLKITVGLDIPDITKREQRQDKCRCVNLLHVYYH